ncbi:hypothetical protein DFH08DRAFT_818429 [Mycena albidolilacea]|uniref:Uncharacterized protein n=1 Tax=Mycena albidolilacea TaxID=1033008 RepID=A0AAD6ZG86_9AGAR|nr:hypothetical protein DFH08DRAFT_818429 [Mycena albidolilacea]
MSLPLPPLDTVTGGLLIGTWISSLLYMLEIIQSVYYFRHFEHDDWKFKTLVTVALIVDCLAFIGSYICVYLYTITHAGDLEYLTKVNWPIPLYGFATGVLAGLVQAFLVFRYWRFTQKKFIAVLLSLGIVIAFGSACTISWMLIRYTASEDRQIFKLPMPLWLATEAAVDVGIASVLLWEFRRAKAILTETQRRVICHFIYLPGSGINSALNRLTAVTIQSGAAAATLAGGGLIVSVAQAALSRQSNLQDHEPRSVWDIADHLAAFEPQYPEIRKAFLHDRNVYRSWDLQRRARAVDVDQLGHRRLMRYSSAFNLDPRQDRKPNDLQKRKEQLYI